MQLAIAVHLYLFSCVFLQFLHFLSADDIPCNVTQESSETLYSIPEFIADDCNYQWANTTGSVLANHGHETDKIVKAKDVRTLRTSECLKEIHYQRDCISEGTPHTATCTSNCTENAAIQVKEDGVPFYMIAVIVLVILVLLVLCFVCIRKKLCRRDLTGSCSQARCVYRNVKTSNHPSNTTDEEAAG